MDKQNQFLQTPAARQQNLKLFFINFPKNLKNYEDIPNTYLKMQTDLENFQFFWKVTEKPKIIVNK